MSVSKTTFKGYKNYQKALKLDSEGKELEAIPIYELALEQGLPENEIPNLLICLGSSYRVIKNYQKSLEILETASQKYPDNLAVKTFLAMTLFDCKNFQKATSLLLEIVATNPTDQNLQNFQKAIEFYSQNI
jgi:tetratricopeptide (TPR) repeat protein